jgi:hypothetical protein
MPHLALGGLSPVPDLCQQRRLNPYAAMSNALAVGLGISHLQASRFQVRPPALALGKLNP